VTGLRRGILCAFVLEIAALGAARGAVAQPTGSIKQGAAIAKAPAAAALPTPTPAKKVLVKPRPITGGTVKVSYGPGAAKAHESAALLSSINGESQASRTVPGNVRFNPVTRTPGIGLVNGHGGGFKVTPGAYLTIAGFEFGDAKGQVNLIGNFPPSGVAALTIVDWKAGSIYALLPTGLRGVLDQTVILQIVTAAGRTYRHDGGSFVATREDTTVTTNIRRFVKFQSGPTWSAELDESGSLDRRTGGDNINCPAVGSDTLTMLDPGKGFLVTGFNMNWNGRTDSGDGDQNGFDGSRTFTPGYSLGDWNGPSIPIRWGVSRSHTSAVVTQTPAYDFCSSSYAITVNLQGPAGVSPF
jgi:hypothetical protein